MATRLFCGMVIAAVVAVAIFSAVERTAAPRIEDVTIEAIHPYLDAAMKMKPNLVVWNCPNPESANFDQLPAHGIRRDLLLETLALDTVYRFRTNTKGDRMSKYIPLVELDNHLRKFAVDDSPWGLFGDQRLQEAIKPYFEEAKAAALAASG